MGGNPIGAAVVCAVAGGIFVSAALLFASYVLPLIRAW